MGRQQGFTLVELVMTMVIIGILSAAAIGLFASRSDYAPFLAKDVLISSSLLAQQRALANQQNNPVTLTIRQTVSDWQFSVAQGSVALDDGSKRLDRSGTTLRVNGAVLADGGSVVLSYDRLGSTGSNQCFEFQGPSQFDVCVSSAGYAYDCNCP